MEADRAYARWAPFYPPRAHNPLMEVEEAAVGELMPTVAGRRVLDVGCGTGRYLGVLARAGAATMVGVDRSREMLRRVRVRGARLIRADVRGLPLRSASVDAVTCGLMIMDVEEIEVALEEMTRVLVPGGVLVYSTLHPSGAVEGWTRTFDTPDGRHALATCFHTLERHLGACRSAGLVVDARREPALSADASSAHRPVALVIRATRVA